MSLYLPERFAQADQTTIAALIDAYPFATLISVAGDEPHITHAPVIRTEQGSLLAHIACANPQAALLVDGASVTCIFNGPHDYISSTWYAKASVPTWNYAVVHAVGSVRVIADEEGKQAAMDALIQTFEPLDARANSPHLSRQERAPLLSAIHVFAIEVHALQAKFKLSQNKPAADRYNIIAALQASGRADSSELAAWMQRELDRDADRQSGDGTAREGSEQ